jgi:hypothetical protein
MDLKAVNMREIDQYFLQQDEPTKGCLLFMREYILKLDSNIVETWKYKMPIYCYHEKMFCYLWIHKKYHQPYLGIVEGSKINHPDLIQEKRARMKILLLDPTKDIPVRKVGGILKEMLTLYRNAKK